MHPFPTTYPQISPCADDAGNEAEQALALLGGELGTAVALKAGADEKAGRLTA